jgi:preprotein translocase subunit YajC
MNIKKGMVAALALAVIGVSLFFLLHKPTEKAEQTATNASEALGLRAGEEVAQLLGQKGRVAVLEMEFKPGEAPTALATTGMFRQALKKHGVTVARTKAIPGGLTALVMGRGISRDDYVGLVEGAPSVDAVVTFAGLPAWAAEELHQFQANHPALVVVDIFGTLKGPVLPEMVEQRTVALAFSPRSATEVEQQGNEQRMFERYYRILGPQGK